VALLFYWPEISKQVRIVGIASKVGDVEADQYFATRPRQSQIGAWASRQSSVIEDRFELEKRLAKTAARFSVGPVPRPDFWSGFSVLPSRIEFWQKKAFRLHERHLFVRSEGAWIDQKLYP
jgi:pyridoxamine 5'-phosphate oxidase